MYEKMYMKIIWHRTNKRDTKAMHKMPSSRGQDMGVPPIHSDMDVWK